MEISLLRLARTSGRADPDFESEPPAPYKGAQILVAGKNFGCGSSREHAAWALHDYGFRCVIAPCFADIFHSNAGKNGILLVTLPEEQVERSCRRQSTIDGYKLSVSLEDDTITDMKAGFNQLRDRSVSPLLPARGPRRHRPDAAPRQSARRIRACTIKSSGSLQDLNTPQNSL